MGMYNDKPITEFGLACPPGSSLTKQAMAAETDINNILKKFQKTGMVEQLAQGTPFYGDVSEIADYQKALNIINEANGLFMAMSPDIRERFGNDPQKMISFLEDPKNLDEAIALGMAVKRPETVISEAKSVNDSGSATAKP